jgi:pyruvate/2-oxoglutarate/acetoin dehydrogenase E1 component
MSEPITAKAPTMTGAEATRSALDEALSTDASVLVFGEDVADREGGGILGATKGLSSKHGNVRVRSTPISEQAIVGAAVGAAIAGMRPVAEIMLMNFITLAMDQLVNHAAKIRFMSGGQTGVPLTIRTMSGAGRGTGGQHSDMLEVWLAHVPGLKVVMPSNAADWKGLLLSCIFDDNPCVFIENTNMMRMALGAPPPPGHRVPLGKANIVRAGTDATIISYGRPMFDVLKVAERLGTQGTSIEVIDLRTVMPFDRQTLLTSVAKTRRAVVVHEAVRQFGVGAEIASCINEELFDQLAAPVLRVGSKNTPVPASKVLEKGFMWSEAAIEDAVRTVLNGRRK